MWVQGVCGNFRSVSLLSSDNWVNTFFVNPSEMYWNFAERFLQRFWILKFFVIGCHFPSTKTSASLTEAESPIYTTFMLGPTLLKMCTRAITFGTDRLIFCRVNAKFLARGPQNSGRPGPHREVVLARLKSGPRAKKRFCGAFGHR